MARPIKVLFVCVANSCRSQMAEVVAKRLDREGNFYFESAGAMPAGIVDSGVREYAQSKGWDISGQRSKSLDEILPLAEFDAVVALCAEACVSLPALPKSTTVLQWPFADPTGSVGVCRQAAYENLHRELEEKITALMQMLKQG
ncbi:MAG: arsenate reductase ArsC [Bdellovibrionales bacterium]|nr:arsenate reductase ArsC [Bdellovibrionales bacterium]